MEKATDAVKIAKKNESSASHVFLRVFVEKQSGDASSMILKFDNAKLVREVMMRIASKFFLKPGESYSPYRPSTCDHPTTFVSHTSCQRDSFLSMNRTLGSYNMADRETLSLQEKKSVQSTFLERQKGKRNFLFSSGAYDMTSSDDSTSEFMSNVDVFTIAATVNKGDACILRIVGGSNSTSDYSSMVLKFSRRSTVRKAKELIASKFFIDPNKKFSLFIPKTSIYLSDDQELWSYYLPDKNLVDDLFAKEEIHLVDYKVATRTIDIVYNPPTSSPETLNIWGETTAFGVIQLLKNKPRMVESLVLVTQDGFALKHSQTILPTMETLQCTNAAKIKTRFPLFHKKKDERRNKQPSDLDSSEDKEKEKDREREKEKEKPTKILKAVKKSKGRRMFLLDDEPRGREPVPVARSGPRKRKMLFNEISSSDLSSSSMPGGIALSIIEAPSPDQSEKSPTPIPTATSNLSSAANTAPSSSTPRFDNADTEETVSQDDVSVEFNPDGPQKPIKKQKAKPAALEEKDIVPKSQSGSSSMVYEPIGLSSYDISHASDQYSDDNLINAQSSINFADITRVQNSLSSVSLDEGLAKREERRRSTKLTRVVEGASENEFHEPPSSPTTPISSAPTTPTTPKTPKTVSRSSSQSQSPLPSPSPSPSPPTDANVDASLATAVATPADNLQPVNSGQASGPNESLANPDESTTTVPVDALPGSSAASLTSTPSTVTDPMAEESPLESVSSSVVSVQETLDERDPIRTEPSSPSSVVSSTITDPLTRTPLPSPHTPLEPFASPPSLSAAVAVALRPSTDADTPSSSTDTHMSSSDLTMSRDLSPPTLSRSRDSERFASDAAGSERSHSSGGKRRASRSSTPETKRRKAEKEREKEREIEKGKVKGKEKEKVKEKERERDAEKEKIARETQDARGQPQTPTAREIDLEVDESDLVTVKSEDKLRKSDRKSDKKIERKDERKTDGRKSEKKREDKKREGRMEKRREEKNSEKKAKASDDDHVLMLRTDRDMSSSSERITKSSSALSLYSRSRDAGEEGKLSPHHGEEFSYSNPSSPDASHSGQVRRRRGRSFTYKEKRGRDVTRVKEHHHHHSSSGKVEKRVHSPPPRKSSRKRKNEKKKRPDSPTKRRKGLTIVEKTRRSTTQTQNLSQPQTPQPRPSDAVAPSNSAPQLDTSHLLNKSNLPPTTSSLQEIPTIQDKITLSRSNSVNMARGVLGRLKSPVSRSSSSMSSSGPSSPSSLAYSAPTSPTSSSPSRKRSRSRHSPPPASDQ